MKEKLIEQLEQLTGKKVVLKEDEHNTKRYVAVIDLYIYAESDEDAKLQANTITKTLDDKEDNHAKVIELGEQPFGTTHFRKIQ